MRHGHMGFITKAANTLKKFQDSLEADVEGKNEVFNEDWNSFVGADLKQINDTNARSLGGQPRSKIEEEDDATQFDVNMEKIMSRFNTFNSLMSQSSGGDDDDDDKQDEPEEEDDNAPLTQLGSPKKVQNIEVELPDATKLEKDYLDSSYWKPVIGCEDSLEDLLSDYE